MEVSILFDICTYSVFTLYGGFATGIALIDIFQVDIVGVGGVK